jgi:hypothetical protein
MPMEVRQQSKVGRALRARPGQSDALKPRAERTAHLKPDESACAHG